MSDTDFSHCVMLMVLMSVESFSVIPPGFFFETSRSPQRRRGGHPKSGGF